MVWHISFFLQTLSNKVIGITNKMQKEFNIAESKFDFSKQCYKF